MANISNCKCEGRPPCMTRQTSSSNGPSRQSGGYPAEYNNGRGQSKSRSGGCPSWAPPSPPPPPRPPPKCKPPKTPQAKQDPVQSLFDRYNVCCPGKKCPPPEPGPQCSTGRRFKKHKNGYDLYDTDMPRPSC